LIGAMRTLGLDYLVDQLDPQGEVEDAEKWYNNLRNNDLRKLFSYLVEDAGKIEKVYIIEPLKTDSKARLTVHDLTRSLAEMLPFMKPSGSQSAQIGPIIKRTFDNKNGAGPSEKILNTTIKYFEEIAEGDKPWADYFKDILKVLKRKGLELPDGSEVSWSEDGYSNMLSCAVDKIGPQKNTAFLTVRNREGLLPGESQLYLDYLMQEKLAGERYVTADTPFKEDSVCPLCGTEKVRIFPNALKGAGINLTNADRAGVFPSINTSQAWKKYALCAPCADLLYIYKFHLLKKGGPNRDQQPFAARIAGEPTLIIPLFFPGVSLKVRRQILGEVKSYIDNIKTDVGEDEENLLDILKDRESIMNFIFLWADVGQNIDNVTGMVSNVLPSRLRRLSEINYESKSWCHALFPKYRVSIKQFDFRADLQMKALRSLFFRPGGTKVKALNTSVKLAKLKKTVAACVYLEKPIPVERFWEEMLVTARCYVMDAIKRGDCYTLLNEGEGKNGPFLTVAGWIKNFNWWIYYFKRIGVLTMEERFYEPNMDSLKPFFGPESGIDNDAKAYAFLLGVLYGKLLQVQGARNVNVGANALTWLKRLTLKGKDLPDLYIKIREKLLAYGTEGSDKVKELLTEIGWVGIKLGDKINLNETQTNYYLLLGQSMTSAVLPKKEEKGVTVND